MPTGVTTPMPVITIPSRISILPFPEGEARVVPTEAERGGEGNVKIGMLRGQRRIVEVTVGVRLRQVDRRGRNAVPQGQHGGDGLRSTCRAEHVAGHGLGGADGDPARTVFAERFFDRERLDAVIHRRAGAVGVEVDAVGIEAGLAPGIRDGAGALCCAGIGGGDVIGVTGGAVASQFGVDCCAALLRMLQLLEDEHTGAFAHDEARTADVEGQGSRVRIFGGGEGLLTVASAPPATIASA